MAFCWNCGKQLEGEAELCESCRADTSVAAKPGNNGADNASGDAAGSAPSRESLAEQYKLSFRGDSGTFFKIWISNLLLTVLTLGIYYPWGRANMKRYIYSSTYIGDHSFEFHGKGKQMFIGLLKFSAITLLLFVAAIVAMVLAGGFGVALTSIFLRVLLVIAYMPILGLFIHGARRFRMSRTSYRGIRFGYRGKKKSLIWIMTKGALLIPVTLGIYTLWLINNMRSYIYNNTKFGNMKSEFTGKSSDFFWMKVVGTFLSYVTLGIYYFWYKKNQFYFFYENLCFKKDGAVIEIVPKATPRQFFSLIAGNWLILIFTLGIGYPIAKVRTLRFTADNLELVGDVDLNTIIQTEEQYRDALGDAAADIDDSADFFDLDVF
ncbi:MAG: YjgN family protein [Chitinispirillia bacterium]|nr:YjgN family protein [Chitinispirillia bacterium]MCL2241982.1 YjgN family protein [Chitinispirillia bacterium]